MPVRISRASSVIVHPVPPDAVDRFLALQEDLTKAIEPFPGYQGTDLFPPVDPSTIEWVVLIHFADSATLQVWLDSPVRATWVAKIMAEVGAFRLESLPKGFGSWFAGHSANASDLPPGWKMVLVVLLGLYPTVVVLTETVGQVTGPLGFALAMLIGNAMSVSLLQYVVMPVLTRVFGPWLHANALNQRAKSLAGLGIVVLILATLTALFHLASS